MHQDNQPTFFFFDYETWGTSPAKDRPSQFAGVRTDENFNIIGEPLVMYCRPPADYLPSPEAALITGITPQKAMQEAYPSQNLLQKFTQSFRSQRPLALDITVFVSMMK